MVSPRSAGHLKFLQFPFGRGFAGRFWRKALRVSWQRILGPFRYKRPLLVYCHGSSRGKWLSAFFSSAAFVKLNEPVSTVSPSITMILLWAMTCCASIRGAIPELAKKQELPLRELKDMEVRETQRFYTQPANQLIASVQLQHIKALDDSRVLRTKNDWTLITFCVILPQLETESGS
ncbi:MAG: hypothetical protein JWM16_4333 [Verrucomicrobiales bacterium]|nr:hypothetical protein [Verrucomicrobiales bacterium]